MTGVQTCALPIYLGYQPNAGWLFTNLSGSLGGAGILGVPGTNNPTAGLSTGTGTGTGTGTNNPPAAVPTFTITPPTTPAPLVVGNHTATIPVKITPLNGFLGDIAMNFPACASISGRAFAITRGEGFW